uniref:Uncharacterized protein n=1 Tax=Trichuris muris TaxID=70415 RepID=A0A5S6Q8N7_TRIMR
MTRIAGDEPQETTNANYADDADGHMTSAPTGTVEDSSYLVCNVDERPTRIQNRQSLVQRMFVPAILSMLLSLSVIGCGVASFLVSPYFRSRQSYHVEYEWNALSLFLASMCFITAYMEHNLVGVGVSLILAFASLVMAICAIPVHITNAYFRQQDMNTFLLLPNSTFDLQASKYMFKLNVVISILNIFVVAASLYLFQNCRRLLFVRKPCQRQSVSSPGLSILSIIQLVCGLLLGAWLISLEVLLTGSNLNVQSLPGSEALVHCLILIGTAYINIIALGDRGLRMLTVATVMNGLSGLLSLYFIHVPLSMLSFVLERRWSTATQMTFYYEARIFLCALSGLTHLALLLLTFIIFLRFVDRLTSHTVARWFDPFVKVRKFWSSISFIQVAVGIAYALLDLMAVGLFFMYKIDFTPLPAFILCSGLFAHCGFRKGCPILLVLTVIMGYFGIPYCFRDVYLFIFHVSTTMRRTHVSVPASRLTGSNLAVHMLLFLLAIAQIITSFFLVIRTLKTLAMHWRLITAEKDSGSGISPFLRPFAWLQLLTGSIQIVLGSQIFFNRSSLIQLYGDESIMKGMLLCFAAVLLVVSLKYEILLPCSFLAQSVLLSVLLIQMDSDAGIIHNYFDFIPPSPAASQLMKLGYANFATSVMAAMICAIITYKLASLLGGFGMEKVEKNQLLFPTQEMKDLRILADCQSSANC